MQYKKRAKRPPFCYLFHRCPETLAHHRLASWSPSCGMFVPSGGTKMWLAASRMPPDGIYAPSAGICPPGRLFCPLPGHLAPPLPRHLPYTTLSRHWPTSGIKPSFDLSRFRQISHYFGDFKAYNLCRAAVLPIRY